MSKNKKWRKQQIKYLNFVNTVQMTMTIMIVHLKSVDRFNYCLNTKDNATVA